VRPIASTCRSRRSLAAIRELERELGVTLFVRTTRRVELTPPGALLLNRARRALAEIDAAIDDARRSARADGGVMSLGYGRFGRRSVVRIAEALAKEHTDLEVRLREDVTPELLRSVANHELAAAAVLETPAAARHHGIRVDTLRDEPLLAALPEAHEYAHADAIPIGAFAVEQVLLPREPAGQAFNAWLRAVLRAAGFELERTLETLSAPWDRRMLPVAVGEAVSVLSGEWADEPIAGVAAVPFDPPLTMPIDLASSSTPVGETESLVETALRLRDAEGWLIRRPARTDLPGD
jgi:DNA-binding transcriptional LysR family regulator